MKIATVSDVFSQIEKTSSRTEITQMLAGFLANATALEAKELCYLLLGELYPPYKASQYAIAQKMMLKIVARTLNFHEHDIEKKMAHVGDLGSLIEQEEWMSSDQHLSVSQVYQSLVQLEALSGMGSQEKKIDHMIALLQKLDQVSAKYIIRIVMGTLRLGFSDMTIIDALSWMVSGNKLSRGVIEQAYNVCADIGLIAYELKSHGLPALERMKIHMGIPIRPAAAERLPDCKAIVEKLGHCVAQPKLDGFRLQIHIDKSHVGHTSCHFFSRNLIDISTMFPEFVEVCQKINVTTLIADGEAMVYDPETGHFLPFQETVKRRRKHGIDELVSSLPLQLHLFDVLYLNEQDLLARPHKERRALLAEVLRQVGDDRIQLIDEKDIRSAEALEDYFVHEIECGLEGVVVKKIDAPYQAGKRNFNWIKMKYEASSKLEDTIDVVILGYYPGKGKRANMGIGAFLVGIFNPECDRFETLAKIGTGLSDSEWSELKKMCDAHAVAQQPHNVECNKALFPAVWVDPVIVCEVLADNITISPVHSAGKTDNKNGLALRFPRFVKYREDKSPEQTTTYQELASIVS